MEQPTKSRTISVGDFYSNLQMEWLSYKLRELIYVRECDKKRFNDICAMKKQKIEEFAFKNCRKSIFNSEEFRDKYISRFTGDGFGIPCFEYKDVDFKTRTEPWDKIYFFAKDTEITTSIGNGIVIENHSGGNQVDYISGGRTIKAYYCDCKRDVVELLKENVK